MTHQAWTGELAKRSLQHELNLTPQEKWIVDQTLKTWNLDLFTEYFFRLPNSGSRWMPGDSLGHYRHLFNYDLLYDGWCEAGRPEESLLVKTPDYQYNLRVLWDGETPNFLLPHGYLFLDWARPMIDRQTDIALVIAGYGHVENVLGGDCDADLLRAHPRLQLHERRSDRRAIFADDRRDGEVGVGHGLPEVRHSDQSWRAVHQETLGPG